jgi:hypothetical protein
MASRPYFNHSGRQLIDLFESCGGEAQALKTLRAELIHRNTPTMLELRVKVDAALAKTDDAVVPGVKVPGGIQPRQTELSLSSAESASPASRSAPFESVTSGHVGHELPGPASSDEMDDSGGPIRGRVGSIRPCGAIAGVPSRWAFPDKRDVEIEAGRSATRVDRFVAE